MKVQIKPQRLLREGMLASADNFPEKTALIVEGNPITYSELKDSAMRMESVLISLGVNPGDRVAIYMDNTLSCVISIYGTLMAGGVFLVINPQTKQDKLHFILEDSGASILISDSHLAGSYIPGTKNLPDLKAVISSGELPETDNGDLLPFSFEELVEEAEPLVEPVPVIPNDLAALIYTSGSTGFPKGVMQTHQSMVFAAGSIIEYLRMTEEDRIILMLPLAFDYGLYQLLMAMKLGATLILERSFIFPALIYKRIEEWNVTVFPGVPTIYATMVAAYRKSKISFPSVTAITNTAAALPVEFLSDLKLIFPNALIFKMYGLTECKRVSYLEPELLDEKPGSVGKAIPGTEVFIKTADGKPTKPNEPGFLYVRGPHVMAGYWKRPEQTNKMLSPGKIPGERVLCTHDWMRMDEEGFLYFVGRSDDIIKTRGEKVSPLEVENVLHAIDGVKEAVVLGVPDKVLGEAIRAFVVLISGSNLAEKDIKRECTQKLENFMVPQEIIILDKMPISPNGKISKKELAAWSKNE